MRILMPSRILDRHVGGNTTYGQNLEAGLVARGVKVGRIPCGSNPYTTAVYETASAIGGAACAGEVLHYVADTGPIIKSKRPAVVTVHGVASRWIPVARNRAQEAVWRWRVRAAIRSCDAVITVSNSSANDISDVFSLDRSQIHVIQHGIEHEKFESLTSMSEVVANQIPDDYVLYVGNLEPRKNLVNLVRAFEDPDLAGFGLPLVVVGKPAWNFQESLDAIRASPHVIYLGFVSEKDKTALMQGAAAFAFPSFYEGFGFPVLEALSAGALVVTSSAGALAEIAGPSYRFPSLDPAGIASGLAHALRDCSDRSTFSNAGRSWARQFSWDGSVDSHLQIYRGLSA